jgi:hypothetical protein
LIEFYKAYAKVEKDLQMEEMMRVRGFVLETRLLHALQLADAIRAHSSEGLKHSTADTSSGSSAAPISPQHRSFPPFERIWTVSPTDTASRGKGASFLSGQRYRAADAFIESSAWNLNSWRNWGWTSLMEPVAAIRERDIWLKDDELAHEAVIRARRNRVDAGSFHEELLIERALVALSAAVVSSKDAGRLVAAPLLASDDAMQALKDRHEASREDDFSESWLAHLIPEPQEVDNYERATAATIKGLTLPNDSHIIADIRRSVIINRHLAEGLQVCHSNQSDLL